MRRRRRAVAGLAGVALLVVLSACGALGDPPDEEPPKGALEVSTLKVSVQLNIDAATFFVAQDKGYFREEGLSIDLTVAQKGSATIDNLAGGSVDVGLSSYPPGILARVKKAAPDLTIVADGATTTPELFGVVVKKDSPIKVPADLAGKKIAVSSKGGIGELALRSQMKARDIKIDPNLFIPFGFADMPSRLEAGDIDAAIMNEPYLTTALQEKGVQKVIDPFTGPTADFSTTGFFAKKSFIDKHPNTMAAFVRAIVKAAKASNDRLVVQQVIQQNIKVDKKIADLMRMPIYQTTAEPSRLQRVIDLMVSTGEMKPEQSFNIKDMIWDQSPHHPNG